MVIRETCPEPGRRVRGGNYFTSGNPALPRITRIFTDFYFLFLFVVVRETCPEVPPEPDEGLCRRVVEVKGSWLD